MKKLFAIEGIEITKYTVYVEAESEEEALAIWEDEEGVIVHEDHELLSDHVLGAKIADDWDYEE